MIHPSDLTPGLLLRTVNEELAQSATPLNIASAVDLNGLQSLTRLMGALIPHASQHQQTACHITS